MTSSLAKSTRINMEDLQMLLNNQSTNNQPTEINMDNSNIGDSDVELLATHLSTYGSHVERLLLGSNKLSEKGLLTIGKSISNCDSLSVLSLDDNNLSDADVIKFIGLLTPDCPLKEISLNNNKMLSDNCIPTMVEFCKISRNIELIALQNTSVTSLGYRVLMDALESKKRKVKKEKNRENKESLNHDQRFNRIQRFTNTDENKSLILVLFGIVSSGIRATMNFAWTQFQFMRKGKITKDAIIATLSIMLIISNATMVSITLNQVKVP